jgi:hypothetical protein
MQTTKITGTHYESVLVNVSKTRFEMSQNSVIYSGGEISQNNILVGGGGIIEDIVNKPGIHGNIYDIDGTINGLISAITAFGSNTEINIGEHANLSASYPLSLGGGTIVGTIGAAGDNSKVRIAQGAEVSGTVAVLVSGSGASVTNSGHISDSLYGLVGGDPAGGGAIVHDIRLVNNGLIESIAGMFAVADHTTLVNGAKGEIVGFAAGMGAVGNATIVNHGVVRVTMEGDTGLLGPTAGAIVGGVGVQKVTNDGTLVGDVVLGEESDTFSNIGGVVRGKIYGGDGNDTFSTDNAKYKMVELADEGTDTVRSTVSYKLSLNVENLALLGTKNANATGNLGDNGLQGNKGDNVLTGLAGIDTFHFGTKGGTDTIADFVIGTDKIDLSKWTGIADFDDVLSHAKNHGDDVWITVGKSADADVLIIADHHKIDLVDTDFLFA